MKKLNVAAIAIFALGVGLIAGPAISAGQSNVINACVNKSTGLLRIAKKCTKSERPLSWNKEGVQGKQGLPGLQGTPGLSGPSGSTPVALAGNCFQLLSQAESLGYLWGIPANLAFFEQRTNCKVREIDLNPNSQIQGFYPGTAPHVLSQKIVSYQGGGGEGYNGTPLFAFGFRTVYEITFTKPEGQELCSSSGEMWRVFKSPINSKTYAVGYTYGNQQRITTDIVVGSGVKSLEVQTETNHSTIDDDGTLIDSGYSVSDGRIEVDFEDVPIHMPLGSTYKLQIKSVSYDGEIQPSSNFLIKGSGGTLAGLVHEENEPGYVGIYTLTANDFERGISNLQFSIVDSESGGSIGDINFDVGIGVQNCAISADPNSAGVEFNGYSNLYRIRETNPIPEFFDLYGKNFEQSIGWVRYRWFDLDPNDFPSEE